MNASLPAGDLPEMPKTDGDVSAATGFAADFKPWALDIESVAASLQTSAQRGLCDEEASDRLERFGPNQIRTAPPRGALAILLEQFRDWMIGLLMAAAIVSALIGEWQDSLLIMAIVVANAVIGFVQERRAEDAVAALKRLARPIARVLRAGQWRDAPAAELVRGDIIELGPGSIVPADARVIETVELQTDEAPLTGESLSVTKATDPVASDAAVADRTSMVFAGTAAVAGRGLAIVTSTGMDSELGKIAALLETAEAAPTPLQVRLGRIEPAAGGHRGWHLRGRFFCRRVARAIVARRRNVHDGRQSGSRGRARGAACRDHGGTRAGIAPDGSAAAPLFDSLPPWKRLARSM